MATKIPDLTPLDFFLWGYLKDKVHKTGPASLDELQDKIRHEIVVWRRKRMARRATRAMRSRAEKCIRLDDERQAEGRWKIIVPYSYILYM